MTPLSKIITSKNIIIIYLKKVRNAISSEGRNFKVEKAMSVGP